MQENLNLETLQNQFRIVRSETNTSHVMEYGDMVSTICELIFGVDKVNVRYILMYRCLPFASIVPAV